MPRKPKKPGISLRDEVVVENLPMQYVHYPPHYGTFICFSDNKNSDLSLCSCCRTAVYNYIELNKINYMNEYSDPLRMATIDNHDFPQKLAEMAYSADSPEDKLIFHDGICHKCNSATPTLRYCHEMYGGEFIQYYGWYVNQTGYSLGILSHAAISISFSSEIIEDSLPDDFLADYKTILKELDEINILKNGFIEIYCHSRDDKDEIFRMMTLPGWENILIRIVSKSAGMKPKNAKSVIHNFYKDAIPLEKSINNRKREFRNNIENITRQEFGFKKIGERWINETILFNMVRRLFPDEEIFRHHRPEWLDGLELDIYLPSREIAFEYQGQQHYYPIDAWGGETALVELKRRDRKKSRKCAKKGVKLIAISFREPLTENHIKDRIKDAV